MLGSRVRRCDEILTRAMSNVRYVLVYHFQVTATLKDSPALVG